MGTVDILLISTLPNKAVSVEHPRKPKITKAKGRSQRKISSMIDDSTAKIKGLIDDNSLTQHTTKTRLSLYKTKRRLGLDMLYYSHISLLSSFSPRSVTIIASEVVPRPNSAPL